MTEKPWDHSRSAAALVVPGATDLRPAALSHHLTVLKLADLVRVERRGQHQVYSLNTTVFQDFVSEMLSWLTEPAGEHDAPQSRRGDSV